MVVISDYMDEYIVVEGVTSIVLSKRRLSANWIFQIKNFKAVHLKDIFYSSVPTCVEVGHTIAQT